MYAALDLGQKTVRAVLKRQDGKIVNELKIKKQRIETSNNKRIETPDRWCN